MALSKLRDQERQKAKIASDRVLFEELKHNGSLLRCKHIPMSDAYECVIHNQGHRSWVPWKLVNRWLYDKKVKLASGANDVIYGTLLEH